MTRRRRPGRASVIAACLLLCAATLAAWALAAREPRLVTRSDTPAGVTAVSWDAGRVTYYEMRLSAADPMVGAILRTTVRPGIGGGNWRAGGFVVQWREPIGVTFGNSPAPFNAGALTVLSVPFWFPAAAFALPPAVMLWRGHTRRRRLRLGLCLRCGYDLRASGGRCPECGTVAPGAEAGT